jgi:hypothetical protein
MSESLKVLQWPHMCAPHWSKICLCCDLGIPYQHEDGQTQWEVSMCATRLQTAMLYLFHDQLPRIDRGSEQKMPLAHEHHSHIVIVKHDFTSLQIRVHIPAPLTVTVTFMLGLLATSLSACCPCKHHAGQLVTNT